MQEYRGNKFKTAIGHRAAHRKLADSIRDVFQLEEGRLATSELLGGTERRLPRGTHDWDIVYELLVVGTYQRAMDYLRQQPDLPLVLSGSISLLTASSHSCCEVVSFEPGPPNHRLFVMNPLTNQTHTYRIELRKEAFGGMAHMTKWFFDEQNPGRFGLSACEG